MISISRILYLNIVLMSICCACYSQSVTDSDKAEIIKSVLQSSTFQNFFHSDIESRTPLYLLNNKNINKKVIDSIETDFEVKLVTDTTGINKNWVKITTLKIEGDKAQFGLYYKIENMYMSGILTKKRDQWTIIKIEKVIEF